MPFPKRIGYIGLAKQAAKGTGVAPTKFVRWDGSTKMTPDQGITRYREGGDGYNPGITLKENHKPDGSFSMLARPDITGFLLAMWGGQDTLTGAAAPYTHTIVPKSDGSRPWLTIERSIAGQLIERITDGRIKTITLEGEPGKPVKVSVEYLGIGDGIQGAAATETYESNMPFVHANGTYSKDGTATSNIAAWKVTFTNSYDEEDFTNSVTRRDIPLLGWDVELEFTLKLETDNVQVFKDVYFGGATAPGTSVDDGAFKVDMTYNTGANQMGLTVDIPKIYYVEAPLELSTDDEAQTYQIKAHATKGAGDVVTITAKNATQTAYC